LSASLIALYVPTAAPASCTPAATGAKNGNAIDATSNAVPPSVKAFPTSSLVLAPVPPRNPPLLPTFSKSL